LAIATIGLRVDAGTETLKQAPADLTGALPPDSCTNGKRGRSMKTLIVVGGIVLLSGIVACSAGLLILGH
jgi:hypothetical protein